MSFHSAGGLRLYRFDSLAEAGADHAVFTRHGGVSPAPFETLNFGLSVGDDPQAVIENRRRAFAAAGREAHSAPDIWQVHSDIVLPVAALRGSKELPQIDGLVSDSPADTLFLRFADCVPVLLFDPVRRAVGLAHAGWKGTISKVAARAVECMQQSYGCNPANILAGIGPSICADHYLVGEEVVQAARAAFGRLADSLLERRADGIHFDLWRANRLALEAAGVRRIETAAVCTACNTADWFSHRTEGARTGRFGAMIWLG